VLETTNRIALVTANGSISAMALGNGDIWQVSPAEGFYTWPTWSPDASQLVFSGVSRTPGEPKVSLFAFDVASQTSREFYVDEPGATALLANGVVHYPLWSPNSRHLAFIAGTDRGPALFVDDPSNETYAEAVLHNGPL
jgi:Tol biopolymer transport system component